MNRFSTLLEQVLAKVEASREQAPASADCTSAIPLHDVEVPVLRGEGVSRAIYGNYFRYLLDFHDSQYSRSAEHPSLDRPSRKRKRFDESQCVDEDASVIPDVNPSSIIMPRAKRQKRGVAVARGIATAAGFTALGAVATWTTLAYYI